MERQSKYKHLERPEIINTLPEYLLNSGSITPSERHLLLSVARIEQQQVFLIENIIELNENIRDLDIRLQDVESWKNNLMSKWSLFAAGGAMSVSAFVGALFTHLFEWAKQVKP